MPRMAPGRVCPRSPPPPTSHVSERVGVVVEEAQALQLAVERRPDFADRLADDLGPSPRGLHVLRLRRLLLQDPPSEIECHGIRDGRAISADLSAASTMTPSLFIH